MNKNPSSPFTTTKRKIYFGLPNSIKISALFSDHSHSQLHIPIRPQTPAFPTISRQHHAKRHLILKVPSKHEEATQKQNGNGEVPIAKDDRTNHQDRATERRTMSTNLILTATTAQNDTQISPVFTEPSQEQDQEDEISHDAPLYNHNTRTNDSTYNSSPSISKSYV